MIKKNQKLELDDLTIRVTFAGDTAELAWVGICESQDPEVSISPFFRGLMPSLEGSKVRMNFHSCEFINSATISLLFQLMKQFNARKIETEILYNLEMEWQRITFRSVKAVTQTLQYVQVTGV